MASIQNKTLSGIWSSEVTKFWLLQRWENRHVEKSTVNMISLKPETPMQPIPRPQGHSDANTITMSYKPGSLQGNLLGALYNRPGWGNGGANMSESNTCNKGNYMFNKHTHTCNYSSVLYAYADKKYLKVGFVTCISSYICTAFITKRTCTSTMNYAQCKYRKNSLMTPSSTYLHILQHD
jgi:hypothetical protein